MMCGQKNN